MRSRQSYYNLGLAGITLACVALLIVRGGMPRLAAVALWKGSVGSWYNLWSGTMVRAVPLMLAGGAVAIAFRAGVFNIGAEGQLLIGATAAMAVTLALPSRNPVITLLALVAGTLGGALWAGIAAVMRRSFGVLEVISTIMLNFVALQLVSYLVRGPLQEPTHAYPQTVSVPDELRLLRIPGAGRLHIGVLVAIGALVLSGWIIRRTAAGFRLLAVGENLDAARSAGLIDTERVAFGVLLWSGALAGLAGAIEVFGVTFALYEDISPGYGYTAIAVALLAGLDPWLVIPSAIGFGALEAGAAAMQRDANVPSTIAAIVEAVVIVATITVQGRHLLGRSLRFRTAAHSRG